MNKMIAANHSTVSMNRKLDRGELQAHVCRSPVGDMAAAIDPTGALVQLHFLGQRSPKDFADRLQASGYSIRWDAEALNEVIQQVAEYFDRKRKRFDLRLRLSGTAFQMRVWNELLQIPYGQTLSYRDLASRVGRPGASRAVGRANGANPVALIVPCHRVIGADRSLTGYGGGIDIKKALLTLEGALPPVAQPSVGLFPVSV